MARITTEDLRGLLSAIEMAESALESGCDVPETIAQVHHASRCYDWVLAEIRKRERKKLARRTRRARST